MKIGRIFLLFDFRVVATYEDLHWYRLWSSAGRIGIVRFLLSKNRNPTAIFDPQILYIAILFSFQLKKKKKNVFNLLDESTAWD